MQVIWWSRNVCKLTIYQVRLPHCDSKYSEYQLPRFWTAITAIFAITVKSFYSIITAQLQRKIHLDIHRLLIHNMQIRSPQRTQNNADISAVFVSYDVTQLQIQTRHKKTTCNSETSRPVMKQSARKFSSITIVNKLLNRNRNMLFLFNWR